MSRHRVVSLEDAWADRLGIDSCEGVQDELQARFEHLARFVLTGELPPAGDVSAEAATAYGDLWVLAGFLADARNALTREEAQR